MNPGKTVLVCGSKALDPRLQGFAESLGRLIVNETNWILMSGGVRQWKGQTTSLDYFLVRGALDAVKAKGEDPKQRIHIVCPGLDEPDTVRIQEGYAIELEYANRRARRQFMVVRSQAMIAVAGTEEGTGEMIDLAWFADKPVLPIPSTGGAAQDRWKKHAKDLVQMFKISPDEQRTLLDESHVDTDTARLALALIGRRLKPTCFVGMKYHNHPLGDIYGAMEKVITEKGYTALRVDRQTLHGNIIIAISEAIPKCELVVADLTGYSPNVLYELGISHTLGKPTYMTIYTRDGKYPPSDQVPFDLRVHAMHAYDSLNGLEDLLRALLPER
ncbi:MAG: hypothetical protein HUU20_16190 [Pirellulales bacterium]|nr:hypothetical protein [Pirellulales bacterium]